MATYQVIPLLDAPADARRDFKMRPDADARVRELLATNQYRAVCVVRWENNQPVKEELFTAANPPRERP